MTIRAHRDQVVDRINAVRFSDESEGLLVVNMDKPLSQISVFFAEVDSAYFARGSVMLDAPLSRPGIALEDVHQDLPRAAFFVAFLVVDFIRKVFGWVEPVPLGGVWQLLYLAQRAADTPEAGTPLTGC